MTLRWIRRGLWALVALTGILFGYLFFLQSGPVERSISFGGPFELTDHFGETITEAAFEGHPTVLFFGFTHCPEVCPTTLYEMEDWMARLGPEGDALKAYFVTIDPERDTPEMLHDYVSNVSDRIIGISGDPEKVREMARSWRVFFSRVELDDGDYTMDHTASIFLVNADGSLRGTIAFQENSDTALEKLRNLVKANS